MQDIKNRFMKLSQIVKKAEIIVSDLQGIYDLPELRNDHDIDNAIFELKACCKNIAISFNTDQQELF